MQRYSIEWRDPQATPDDHFGMNKDENGGWYKCEDVDAYIKFIREELILAVKNRTNIKLWYDDMEESGF